MKTFIAFYFYIFCNKNDVFNNVQSSKLLHGPNKTSVQNKFFPRYLKNCNYMYLNVYKIKKKGLEFDIAKNGLVPKIRSRVIQQ